METELLEAGVELTLVGMGTVLAFLSALVIATSLMSRVAGLLRADGASPGVADDEVAAIAAAIAQYRRER